MLNLCKKLNFSHFTKISQDLYIKNSKKTNLVEKRIIDELLFEKEDYQSWRVPAESVARAVAKKLAALENAGETDVLPERAAKDDSAPERGIASAAADARESMLYVAVALDSNSKDILKCLLKCCEFDMDGLTKFFFDFFDCWDLFLYFLDLFKNFHEIFHYF